MHESNPRRNYDREESYRTADGCVDALSCLGLGQVFTANMTGNIVFLGLLDIEHIRKEPLVEGRA